MASAAGGADGASSPAAAARVAHGSCSPSVVVGVGGALPLLESIMVIVAAIMLRSFKSGRVLGFGLRTQE